MNKVTMVYAGVGSRSTPPGKLLWMERIARDLARAGWTLRSGGARGADTAFARGAGKAGGAITIYRPNDATPESKIIAARHHPRWETLSNYVKGLMGRNAHVLMGNDTAEPVLVQCIIGWTPRGRGTGGTGHTYRVGKELGIPIVDLETVETEVGLANIPHAVAKAIRETKPNPVEERDAVRQARASGAASGRGHW